MVTTKNDRQSVGGQFVSVTAFNGLSTDTKPTNVANGSTFYEIDTGTTLMFDFAGQQWLDPADYVPPDDGGDDDDGGDGE